MSSAREKRLKRRQGQRREQEVVEPLYENSALRDNLDDAQAISILRWGAEQIGAMVRLTAVLPEEEAAPVVKSRATAVQKVIHWLNTAVATRINPEDVDLRQFWDALGHLVALPEELPTAVQEWWTTLQTLPPPQRFAHLQTLLQQPERWAELTSTPPLPTASEPEDSEPEPAADSDHNTPSPPADPAYGGSQTGGRRPQQF